MIWFLKRFIVSLVRCNCRRINLSYFHEAKAHFVASHQHPINQVLHHLNNMLAIAAVVLLFYDWRLTLVCLVLTQVFALGGHALFEKVRFVC